MPARWAVVVYRPDSGRDVHVLPLNDTVAHTELRQCWCQPRVDDENGTALVVHHSADCREYFELGAEAVMERPS